MSKLKELDMHCGNCSAELMNLCDIYTPYENCGYLPLCYQSKIAELDDEKDIEKIEKWCDEIFDYKYEIK